MSEKFTNIAGGPFQPYVSKQIEVRKKFLKESNNERSNNHLIYLTNRNAWMRVTSGVNVSLDSQIYKKYGLSGDELARKYILQGGVIERNALGPINNNLRAGFGTNGAYNLLSNKPLGIKPMPGITSISINTAGTLGTLQYAEISFICYDIEQLEIMDALYMKLGFSLFLEWGHIPYLDNDSNLITNPLPLDIFNANSKEELLKSIQNKRVQTGANYDAMYGTISNFEWEIGTDGSYLCKIKLVGAGDVLESLKINQALPLGNYSKSTINVRDEEDEDDIILSSNVADRDLSILNRALFDISQYMVNVPNTGQDSKINIKGVTNKKYRRLLNKIYTKCPYKFIQFDDNGKLAGDPIATKGNHYSLISGLNENNGSTPTNIPKLNENLFNVVSVLYKISDSDDIGAGKMESQNYITLGHLLALITATGMIYSKKDGNENKPYVYLDFNDELNYCSTFKGQVSLDPRICIIKRNQTNNSDPFGVGISLDRVGNALGNVNVESKSVTRTAIGGSTLMVGGNTYDEVVGYEDQTSDNVFNSYLNTEEPEVRARLMHIMLNIDFITDVLRDLRGKDEKGEVNFTDFINKILSEVSKCLGGFNEFRITIDDDSRCVRIVDDNKTLTTAEWDDESINKQYTEIPIFGTDSIVYDYKFKSKISPKMASMIVIAAQAEPSTLGSDSFALSNLSRGLTDRLMPVRLTSNSEDGGEITTNDNPSKESIETLSRHLYNTLQNLIIDTSCIDTSLNTYKELLADYRIKKDSTNKGTVIIPLDFTLAMDGISGIIPNSAFTIPVNLLPSSYKTKEEKSKVAFILHKIDHNFTDNKWVTVITGQTINIRFDKEDEKESFDEIQGPRLLNDQPIPWVLKGSPSLSKVIIDTGYPIGSIEYELSLIIGTQEGWDANANGGKGTRAYRNNNPGNLDYSNSLKKYDPQVSRENNGTGRFAQFTTAEYGVRALVEDKIKRWGYGGMPITLGNQSLINSREKYQSGNTPTISQFMYTYSPPNQNNTEGYISNIIKTLKSKYPKIQITRDTKVKDLLRN